MPPIKSCPVVIAHPAHSHPNIGSCPGIKQRDIMRRVEGERAEAFDLSVKLSNRIGLPVSPMKVRRDLPLWARIWDLLTEESAWQR